MLNHFLPKMLLILITATANQGMAEDTEWLNNYQGVLETSKGLRKLGVTLIYDDVTVRGSYYFHDDLTDIPVYGWLLPNNRIELRVQNVNKEITTIIEGRFVRPGKCCDTGATKSNILGAWHWGSKPSKGSPPIFLSLDNATARTKGEGRYSVAGVDDDSIIELAAKSLCKWIMGGKRTEIAELIDYPINVHVGGNRIEIRDSKVFLNHYDQIFTQEFKKRIAQCVPHNMFCKYTGVMLGSGEIWFGADGKVIAINNGSE